jgi:hypothetical protein
MAAGVIKIKIRGDATIRGVSYKKGDQPMVPINSAKYLVEQGAAEYVNPPAPEAVVSKAATLVKSARKRINRKH